LPPISVHSFEIIKINGGGGGGDDDSNDDNDQIMSQ